MNRPSRAAIPLRATAGPAPRLRVRDARPGTGRLPPFMLPDGLKKSGQIAGTTLGP